MTHRRRAGDGFTLIEVVVVVSMVGLIAAVLAAVFTTVIRTAPATENRIDDARSLLGITTWLPRDVGSTSPDSFRTGNLPSSCTGVPTSSQGLLELRWSELGTTLVADYRFVANPDGTGAVVRYACALGGPANALTMTASLLPMPVGASPSPSEFPAPVDITTYSSGGLTTGVRFEIVVLDDDGVTTRSLLALDADTANVMTTLPPATTLVGTTTTTTTIAVNNPPTAPGYTMTAAAGVPVTFTVVPTDPDATDTLTVVGASASQPGWLVNPVSGFDITFTPDTNDGTISYQVSDGTVTVSGTITVTIAPPSSTTTTTTTTSTTSTTTTTTLPPCSADFVSVNPSSIGVKNNGFLDDAVTVTVTSSGACGPLVLSFDPDTTDFDTTPEQLPFNAGTTIEIRKNDFVWRQTGSTPWNFTLQLREGANGPVADTTTLTLVAS